jgi:hypothetical protein
MEPDEVKIMVAAAAATAQYHAATDDAPPSSIAISPPTPRNKLVLPILTPAMQQDIMVQKGTAKSSKPLSIGARPEFADYPLQGIAFPHPNDVCKLMCCYHTVFYFFVLIIYMIIFVCSNPPLRNGSVWSWRWLQQSPWEREFP